MRLGVYLDANMIYGYFLALWKFITGKKKEFEEPEVIKALREGKEKCEYYVSTIAKGEIIRRLRTELKFTEEKAVDEWKYFIQHISAVEFDHKEIDWLFINEIVLKVEIKKRLSNLIHLSVCKDTGLTFLTGDDEILEKCKRFYPNIWSYEDFRKYLSKEEQSNDYERGRGLQDRNKNSWWKENKSKSTSENNKQGRVREKNNSIYERGLGKTEKTSWLILLTHYVRNDNDFAYTRNTIAFNLTDIDSSTLQDYDTKLLQLQVNYTGDAEGKTSYLFSNTTDNKYGLQSMSKPWIVLMNYQANDQPLFITTSRKTLSAIPLKVTADENEAITKLTFNQSFSSNTNLTLAFGYLGTVNTRSDAG